MTSQKCFDKPGGCVCGPRLPHGTETGYLSHGCRCVDCTQANTRGVARRREARFERLRQDPSVAEHGTNSTYNNWGCRCELCTEAHRYAAAEKRRQLEENRDVGL